jgi:hypothetical protein
MFYPAASIGWLGRLGTGELMVFHGSYADIGLNHFTDKL